MEEKTTAQRGSLSSPRSHSRKGGWLPSVPSQVRGGWGWCFRSDEDGAERRLVLSRASRGGSVRSLPSSWAEAQGHFLSVMLAMSGWFSWPQGLGSSSFFPQPAEWPSASCSPCHSVSLCPAPGEPGASRSTPSPLCGQNHGLLVVEGEKVLLK